MYCREAQAASTEAEIVGVSTYVHSDGTITYSFGHLDSENCGIDVNSSLTSLPHPDASTNISSTVETGNVETASETVQNPSIQHQGTDSTIRSLKKEHNGKKDSKLKTAHDKRRHAINTGDNLSKLTILSGKEISAAFENASAQDILREYSILCKKGLLEQALVILKESIRAGRKDVLKQLKHFKFLRPAAKMCAVRQALRFVQLLPREYVDTRTYNMLLSVCAEAKDVKNAIRAADMLRGTGRKLDTILYTNLLKVCAEAGDSDQAFKIFEEMQSSNIKLEKQVFATLVAACSQSIITNFASDRRAQLVLLERAFGLIDLMDESRIQPDVVVWNALITASGRADQLQRAFSVLEEMISRGCRPNARTYACIIDACARARDKELALRVYQKARREGHSAELVLYSAAINACTKDKNVADLETAMAIYTDLQKEGIAPDSALYGSLMMAAGRSGDLDLALALQDEMVREGLKPCVGTESALLTVYVQHGHFDKAQEIYQSIKDSGSMPHLHAINALINAYAKSMHLGNVISLVCDMLDSGVEPDSYTFSGILSACHWADEAELALDVYQAMRRRNIEIDQVHATLLLRMCYGRLRRQWTPAAGPPTKNGASAFATLTPPHTINRHKEKMKLLRALNPSGNYSKSLTEAYDVPWQAHAFQIYRSFASAGATPSMHVLNIILACLRVPWAEANDRASSKSTASGLALQTRNLHAGITNTAPIQRKIGIESVYHVQAISILEDAIVSGLLPSFQLDDGSPIDLRDMLPAVAEVYALTVVSALQRLVDSRRNIKHRCTFIVPSYDGRQVFMPSHLNKHKKLKVDEEHGIASTNNNTGDSIFGSLDNLNDGAGGIFGAMNEEDSYRAASQDDPPRGDSRTGLGVAGVLRRLRLWARERSLDGIIILEPGEISRWSKMIYREVEARSASALALQKPYGRPSGSKAFGMGGITLQQQSHEIRTTKL